MCVVGYDGSGGGTPGGKDRVGAGDWPTKLKTKYAALGIGRISKSLAV
jgi:hypothetical protein